MLELQSDGHGREHCAGALDERINLTYCVSIARWCWSQPLFCVLLPGPFFSHVVVGVVVVVVVVVVYAHVKHIPLNMFNIVVLNFENQTTQTMSATNTAT